MIVKGKATLKIKLLLSALLLLNHAEFNNIQANEISGNIYMDLDTSTLNNKFKMLNNKKKVGNIIKKLSNYKYIDGSYDHYFKRKLTTCLHLANDEQIDTLARLSYSLYVHGLNSTGFYIASSVINKNGYKATPTGNFYSISTLVKRLVDSNVLDSCDYYLSQMNKLVQENNIPNGRLLILQISADYATRKRDYTGAANYLNDAISLSNNSQPNTKSILFQNLTDLFMNLKLYKEAKVYFDSAVKYLNRTSQYAADILNTKGVLLYRIGDPIEAEITLLKSIKRSYSEMNNLLLAQSYSNLASLKIQTKDTFSALQYLRLSDSICSRHNLLHGQTVNKLNRIEIELYLNNFAVVDSLLSTFSAKNLFSDNMLSMFYELNEKYYRSLGNNSYADRYSLLRNNQELKTKRHQIRLLRWHNDKLMKNRDEYIEKLSEEHKTKSSELIIPTLFASTTVFFLVLLKRKYARIKSLQKNLSQTDKLRSHEEVIKSQEGLLKNFENITLQSFKVEIKEALRKKIDMLPNKYRAEFTPILAKIDKKSQTQLLNEFDKHFKGVYPNFINDLSLAYPSLSPSELRLCAFIKLNLSSKEVAELTHRSIGTVENARTTIRKKIGLNKGENLQKFLITFSLDEVH